MLVELYIFFEVVAISLFLASFFTKQEVLWGLTLIITGVLMFTSYNIEYAVYQWNTTTVSYQPIIIGGSYPYLVGINMLFFVLSLVFLLFDVFDKYGTKFSKKND